MALFAWALFPFFWIRRASRGNKGTFVYLPEPPGLMLLVK